MAVDRKQVKITIGTNVIQTGEEYDWTLLSIKGHDFMDIDVPIDDYAEADGGYITNRRYLPRYVTMRIRSKLSTPAQIDATALLLKRYLDIEENVELTIYEHGVTRIGNGVITNVKHPDGHKWRDQPYIVLTIGLPDPWFLGEEETPAFRTAIPLLTFPWNSMTGVGITSGYVTSGNVITVTNDGHKEAGFVLTLTATGAVVNPTVTNQDGDYIKILKTFSTGESVVISTVRGDKYVRCDGVSCTYDRASTFFGLAVGENTITISADSGADDLTKSLKFSPRYR